MAHESQKFEQRQERLVCRQDLYYNGKWSSAEYYGLFSCAAVICYYIDRIALITG